MIIDSSKKWAYRKLCSAAREMRSNPTEAESKLWQFINCRQLGVKFRQQHIIATYIVDFCCPTLKLVIEADGNIHDKQLDKDRLRDENLSIMGYRVIRFTNREIVQNIPFVVERIKNEISTLKSPLGDVCRET